MNRALPTTITALTRFTSYFTNAPKFLSGNVFPVQHVDGGAGEQLATVVPKVCTLTDGSATADTFQSGLVQGYIPILKDKQVHGSQPIRTYRALVPRYSQYSWACTHGVGAQSSYHTSPTGSDEQPATETQAKLSWPPKPVHWIETTVPQSWLPYVHLARAHKPIGSWLLAWPCFWSIALASPIGSFPDPYMICLFGSGAVLLRGAGCTINDMWDRKLDAQVERTRYRPLAAGVINLPQATAFLAAQLSLGLVVLLQLNDFSKVLGASSLFLVATYPLAKRVTNLPQAYLGLTINWGALLGWAAVTGSCDWAVIMPLYLSATAWTLVYDTIYAHMDTADDVRAGVKSTALFFGTHTKPILYGFAATAAALQAMSGMVLGVGPLYYAGVAGGFGHLGWQITSLDVNDPKDCLAKFRSNIGYGAVITAGIVLDKLYMGM